MQKVQLEPAVEMFRDVVRRAPELEDDELVRTVRTSLAELLFKLGRAPVAKEELAQVAAEAQSENNLELSSLQQGSDLMLE